MSRNELKKIKIQKWKDIPIENRKETANYLISSHNYNYEKFNSCENVLECIIKDFMYDEDDDESIMFYQEMVKTLELIISEHSILKDYIKEYKNEKNLDISIFRESMEKLCCICDEKFIKKSYELPILESVGEDLYYGFSVSRKDIIYSIIIVNLDLNVRKFFINEYENKTQYNCEINLVCRNKKYFEKGITTDLLFFVITWCRFMGKKYIYLVIGNYETNKVAENFYLKNGFKPIKEGSSVMVLDLSKVDFQL